MNQRLATPVAGFGAPAIDRSRPLRFRLDGVEIQGFAGDTVLSAALASGTLSAGRIDGAPLRLSWDFSPLVRRASDRQAAGVPMVLCPAEDGLDLATAGRRDSGFKRLAARIRQRAPASLGLRYDTIPPAEAAPVADDTKTDLIIVGGGVAGMAAALEAARRGVRVMLVEERGRLGGNAALFGNRDGEPPVLETLARLTGEIAARPEIVTRLLCRAVDAEPGAMILDRVEAGPAGLVLRRERILARHMVLATGCADRLSVFPGNRMPGLFGLGEAFELAGGYHVWPRGPTLFAGGVNPLYHLALLAKESGADIVRLVDHRPSPHSRFADFAKASGIVQEFGTRVARVDDAGRERLEVATSLAWYDSRSEGNGLFSAGSVIDTDGWQKRLHLWIRLGGRLGWDGRAGVPIGDLASAGVVLAGSAVGLETTRGCVESGERQVCALFGDAIEAIEETRVDEYFESPDAPPLRALPSAHLPAFVSGGRCMVAMPSSAETDTDKRLGRAARLRHDLAGAGSLDIEALLTLVQAGLTPADRFEAVAAERLVRHEIIRAAPVPTGAESAASPGLPAYLAGRFGKDAVEASLISEDGRAFEPGMLIFPDSARRGPQEAVGVVLSARPGGGAALVARALIAGSARVGVGDAGRVVAAKLCAEAV